MGYPTFSEWFDASEYNRQFCSKTTLLIGAGFGVVHGLPLAGQLFDMYRYFDRQHRQKEFDDFIQSWTKWHERTGGWPEQYLAYLQECGGDDWESAKRFVGLCLLHALDPPKVYLKDGSPGSSQYYFDDAGLHVDKLPRKVRGGLRGHKSRHRGAYYLFFRNLIFRPNAIITTNYDTLAEKMWLTENYGLECVETQVQYFQKGSLKSVLRGRRSFLRSKKLEDEGGVPILKLHGSLNWFYQPATLYSEPVLRVFEDCYNTRMFAPWIVPPAENKAIPYGLEKLWQAAAEKLRSSDNLVVFGYSLPEYDYNMCKLISDNAHGIKNIYVIDPFKDIVDKYKRIMPHANAHWLGSNWTAFYRLKEIVGFSNHTVLELL